ncbi:MAG: ABC transporter ATP-binding protein, partial [Pseudomonadota bacterium]
GRIEIGGRDVSAARAADRNLAMVFQSYALYPHLTVAENMATPLKLRDLTWAERLPLIGRLSAREKHAALAAQVRETAEVLKIEALLNRKPGQLSGGQRQRAALGRAMVRKPVAFLMDEPLSNLDAALRVHMRAELSELHRALAATFVYVTHDQAEALTMSDRMAVMMDGEVLQFDAPARIYDAPADLRVASFVGSPKINTLPGEIDGDGRVTCMGAALMRQTSAAPGPVTVGVRPEDLELSAGPAEDALSGRVVHVENLGSDIFLHLAAGDHRITCRIAPQDLADAPLGADVHVRRARGAALVFGADGRRLALRDERRTAEAAVA